MSESEIDWNKIIKALLAVVAVGAVAYIAHKTSETKSIKIAKEEISKISGGKQLKRYTVFLSSTYKDLADERKEIEDVFILAGITVKCMERFTASDKEKTEYIRSQIDESDYIILIIGGRYGQLIPEESISYTEYEFDYAVKKKKPVLPFIIDDPNEKNDSDNPSKLTAFKEKVNRMKTPRRCLKKNLVKEIPASFIRAITDNPE